MSSLFDSSPSSLLSPPPLSLIALPRPSLLHFVYLHPLHVSSLLDSSPLSFLPPPPLPLSPFFSHCSPEALSLSTLSHFEVILSLPLLTILCSASPLSFMQLCRQDFKLIMVENNAGNVLLNIALGFVDLYYLATNTMLLCFCLSWLFCM